jgi:transposase
MREQYTIKQAATAIGVSAQILREWLAETEITTATGRDKRAKYLTRTQVVTLAHAHRRTVQDESDLLALGERVQALSNELEAVKKRLANLERQRSISTEGEAISRPLQSQPGPFSTSRPAAPGMPRTAGVGLRKIDAARLVARHGVEANTAKGWPWPAEALVSEEAAIRWALDYVASIDYFRRPRGWRERCDVAGCPCQQ